MSSPKLSFELSPLAQQDFIDILRHTGKEWGQDQLRTKALGFGLYNVPRSVEHEDWLQQQRSSANPDVGAMNLDESLVRQITRAEKIGSARLTFLNFSRATN